MPAVFVTEWLTEWPVIEVLVSDLSVRLYAQMQRCRGATKASHGAQPPNLDPSQKLLLLFATTSLHFILYLLLRLSITILNGIICKTNDFDLLPSSEPGPRSRSLEGKGSKSRWSHSKSNRLARIMSLHYIRFNKDFMSSFCVILLIDRQTDRC